MRAISYGEIIQQHPTRMGAVDDVKKPLIVVAFAATLGAIAVFALMAKSYHPRPR